MTQLILDFGSNHDGKLGYIEELIDLCKGYNNIAIKLQLCPKTNGNIPIDPAWLPILKQISQRAGLDLICSIWDQAGLDACLQAGLSTVKFAHSQRKNLELQRAALSRGLETVVTHSPMETPEDIAHVTRMWTVCNGDSVTYPVHFPIIHSGMVERWDGFSYHGTDPLEVSRAIDAGYKMVECHVRLGGRKVDCPDNRFAIFAGQILLQCHRSTGGR